MAQGRPKPIFERLRARGMGLTVKISIHNRCIAAAHCARVCVQAVIPVGEMEVSKLQQWLRTFQAYSHVRVNTTMGYSWRAGRVNYRCLQVKLQDLQLICQEDIKSPFKHIPWKHGYMHFSYEMVRNLIVSLKRR
jgi:hypothetical protein